MFTKKNVEWSYEALNNAIGKKYYRRAKLPKIGVLLQGPYLFSRYLSVLRHLDRNEFDLLYIPCPHENEIKNFALSHNFRIESLFSLIRDRVQYKIILSHNMWFAVDTANGYIPSIIGDLHARLMYSAGKEKELLSRQHNSIYDIILCYGPRQSSVLAKNSVADVYEIGNPRLDNYFNSPICVDEYLKTLNLDNKKKNILWLPTISGQNAIKSFIGIMEELDEEYNVILKPHGTISAEDSQIVARSKLNFAFQKENDMHLMAISDFVFCDYGGSAFSAIYLDKNVVLLDAEDDGAVLEVAGKDSSEFYIRDYIKHYGVGDRERMFTDLKNEDIWNEQKIVRKKLSEEFFADFRGASGYRAAKILKNICSGG